MQKSELLPRLLGLVTVMVATRPVGCASTGGLAWSAPYHQTCASNEQVRASIDREVPGRQVYMGQGEFCSAQSVVSVEAPKVVSSPNAPPECQYWTTVIVRNCENGPNCLGGHGRPLRVDHRARVAGLCNNAEWGA